MSWTDERVELLKKLWSDGLSASQIAAELGGITRNAVIGKVHRLGLSGRAKSTSSASPRPRKARSPSHMLRIGRASIRGNTALAHAYEIEVEAEPELIDNIIPIGQRRTILELNEQTCRWPVGDPGSSDFFSAAAIRSSACPIAPITRGSPTSRHPTGAATSGRAALERRLSAPLAEAIVERIAGAAHGADRIGGVAAVERLAQAADMHVDGALVDIDVAAPDAVEQLLARKHPAGPLHQKFEQAEFGRAEIDRAACARHALFLAIEFEIADGEHHGDALRAGAAQQARARAPAVPAPRTA